MTAQSKYEKLAERIAERSQASRERLRAVRNDAKSQAMILREAARNGHAVIQQREKIRQVVDYGIPGFVPTPLPVVDLMISKAEIKAGMTALEPSAGAGHIARPLRQLEVELTLVEWNHYLCDLLRLDGFSPIEMDFLAWQSKQRFDRILMNPPFERLQDIDHVLHANKFLAADGIQVAIMSAGPFFRTDRKAVAFREWLKGRGEAEALPDKIFSLSERPTGVKTYLVKIHG